MNALGDCSARPTIATFLGAQWALATIAAGEEKVVNLPGKVMRSRVGYVERMRPAVTVRSANISVRQRFYELRNEWLVERDPYSSISFDNMLSPAYQQIIGMGEKVLPHLLSDLSSNIEDPPHWFVALAAITGANPVPPEARGHVIEMAKAWIRWGNANGISA